jgi:endonuclease YncB( thermonuclease family)/outer membrane protein OmpA-like peptidoglycan-associated protein
VRKAVALRDELGPFADRAGGRAAEIVEASVNGGLDALLSAKEQGIDLPAVVASGAASNARRLEDLLGADRLADLTEELADLPAADRRKLLDLAASGDVAGTLGRLSELEDVIDGDVTAQEIRDALALRARLGDRLASEVDAQKELVSTLEGELGELVRGLNGRIEASGDIVLPNSDEVLFQQGSAEITPGMQAFLEKACQPWIETLAASGIDVDELRIEGHASSDWQGAVTPEAAFLNNLALSQARSQSVLAACLAFEPDPEIKEWARRHLAAVGYSSARPVTDNNGVENASQSRRVVFSVNLSQDRLIEDLGREIEAGGAIEGPTRAATQPEENVDLPARIEGAATITDADTIRIGDTRIRFFGIDAPERSQTCGRPDGTAWACGKDATAALAAHVGNRPVACDPLYLDPFGRTVAVCKVGDEDIGRWLVSNGHAVAYRKFSMDYVGDEDVARRTKVGLWSGDFTMPWDERDGR